MHKLLYYVTLTNYDKTFHNVKVVYDENIITHTMGQILEENNKTQIRIAETEKYPHVTFFFSGGREEEFKGREEFCVQALKMFLLMISNRKCRLMTLPMLLPELEKALILSV
jgi:bisphosphoglycerate-independent phosphoglycerate mutase (AlkP superfamily)